MLLLAAMRYRNWKQRVIAGLQPVTLETTHNSCFDYSQIPTRQALLHPSPSNSFLLHCVILLQGIVFVVFVVRIRLPRTPASSSSLSALSLPKIDALQPPASAPVLDFSFPINSKDTPPLCQVLFRLRTTLHRRDGHRRHFRTLIEVTTVDAGAQRGRI